ncbi:hypothetical protein Pcinc_018252, partial [Petrolisthes cinctipes]
VFLVAVTYCSALSIQAPSVLIPKEVKPIAIPTQYINNPYWSPYNTYPFPTPYFNPLGISLTPHPEYKATGFPFIWESVDEEASPAVVEVEGSSRVRRDVKEVQVPLPYIHAVPAIAKTTVKTKQLEKVDAATPAHTTKLELTTKEREYTVPAVRYVQPVVKYEPRTYTALSPAVLPYQYGLHPSLGYPFAPAAPIINLQEE